MSAAEIAQLTKSKTATTERIMSLRLFLVVVFGSGISSATDEMDAEGSCLPRPIF